MGAVSDRAVAECAGSRLTQPCSGAGSRAMRTAVQTLSTRIAPHTKITGWPGAVKAIGDAIPLQRRSSSPSTNQSMLRYSVGATDTCALSGRPSDV